MKAIKDDALIIWILGAFILVGLLGMLITKPSAPIDNMVSAAVGALAGTLKNKPKDGD